MRIARDARTRRARKLFSERAMRFMAEGFYAESEAHFREVLRLLPDHASTLNNLGTAIWRQGACLRRRSIIAGPWFTILTTTRFSIIWVT